MKLERRMVLAGGPSPRGCKEKPFLPFNGWPFITIIVEVPLGVVDEVVIAVGFTDDTSRFSDPLPDSSRIVKDEYDGQSPLIGMLAGLSKIHSTYTAVLSCDLPFAKEEVLDFLFKKANGFDAAIPRWPNGSIEPLHAIYHADAALEATKLEISSGGLKNVDMIKRLERTRYVDVDEFRPFDPEFLSFFNVNTPQDYEKAEKKMFERKS